MTNERRTDFFSYLAHVSISFFLKKKFQIACLLICKGKNMKDFFFGNLASATRAPYFFKKLRRRHFEGKDWEEKKRTSSKLMLRPSQ